MCLAGAGVAEVEPNKPFQNLVANFGKHPKLLLPKQHVETAKPHPTTLVESNISHAEMLGLISDEEANGNRKNLFRKRDFNAKDISLINKHLADEREKHMGDDEKPVTADDIDLDVDDEHVPAIRTMLKKHEDRWLGNLTQ